MSEDKWIASPVLNTWLSEGQKRWIFMSGDPLRAPLEWNPLPLTSSGTSPLPFIVSPSPSIRSVTCRALSSFQLGLGPSEQEGLWGREELAGFFPVPVLARKVSGLYSEGTCHAQQSGVPGEFIAQLTASPWAEVPTGRSGNLPSSNAYKKERESVGVMAKFLSQNLREFFYLLEPPQSS